MGGQIKKQLGSRNKQSRVFPTKSIEQAIQYRHFHRHSSLIKPKHFPYQSSVAVSGNLGTKHPGFEDVLSSHEHEIYDTISLVENCIFFEIKTIDTFTII